MTSAQLCVPLTSSVMNRNSPAFQSVATRRFGCPSGSPFYASTRTWPLGGVRVGSGVLKVLGAFWDKLKEVVDDRRPAPAELEGNPAAELACPTLTIEDLNGKAKPGTKVHSESAIAMPARSKRTRGSRQ